MKLEINPLSHVMDDPGKANQFHVPVEVLTTTPSSCRYTQCHI